MQPTVLITGAARGIGLACAQRFAEAGYRVAFHYRSGGDEVASLCKKWPGSQAFCYDLSEEGAAEALVKDVQKEFGQIDCLVNNAGISIDQILPFAKPADFDKLLNTNVRTVFLMSKLCSRAMIKKKRGSIINITSVVGHTGNPGQSMYAASKSAVTGFTQSIAQELSAYNIRCNCVAPGFIVTGMTDGLAPAVSEAILAKIPLKRFGTGAEVAEAVYFLASEASSYITGSTLHVNGGMYTN